MATMAAQFAIGAVIEAYWPDDNMWLAASLLARHGDVSLSIAWEEDGSVSEVPIDYVRPCGHGLDKMVVEQSENIEEASTDAGSSSDIASVGEEAEVVDGSASEDDGMDALMAAAAAAGACDEAEAFVAGNKPPCALHWAEVLSAAPVCPARETAEEERKRCRPPGLMTSAQAWSLAASLGPKRAKRCL